MRHRQQLIKVITALLILLASSGVFAKDSWKKVGRIVAIGDLHGDYEQFRAVLKMTGLIDNRGRWSGGKTHLVQTGDIPDRGPDSIKIIRDLQKLAKSARRARGYVHLLIGNHEAMNVYGDLRYVHQGEYQALINKQSLNKQSDYYQRFITYLASGETDTVFDEAFKKSWMLRYPAGYVEHRTIWEPSGELGKWVAKNNAVIRINDSLFVHGGINPHLPLLPIKTINKMIRQDLTKTPLPEGSIVDSADGPLWYRGLAQAPEETELPDLIKMLDYYKAKRIVMGHSTTQGVINPRFDGRTIVIDVGLATHYGRGMAALIIEGDILKVLHRGVEVSLPPTDDGLTSYYKSLESLEPNPEYVQKIIQQLELLDNPMPETQSPPPTLEGG
ncbi:MAG: metallophosphoesterase [Pseudomonadales bacterium]